MSYRADLEGAASWLAAVQRPDGGWGLTAGQASSIVNTAEALYVLFCSRRFEDQQEHAVEFLAANSLSHLENRGPRIRYAAFAVFGLSITSGSNKSFETLERCIKWLLDARNDDAAWGTEACDDHSNLFSTHLALWALKQAGCDERLLTPSYQWVLAQAGEEGWALRPGIGLSPVATAYGALALEGTRFRNSDRLEAAHRFLLQTRHWGTEEEVIAGTVWKHCTFAAVVPALIQLGELPYAKVFADAIIYMNKLRNPHGGWSETEPGVGQTVRAQFWSVLAFEALDKAFDPAVHVLRLDQERTGSTLAEPDFVTTLANTRYAMIVSARLYRVVAYACLIAALFVLAGGHRYFDKMPFRADAVIALLLFLIAEILIRRRPKQFPRAARGMKWLVATISVVGLIFGTDPASITKMIQDIVARIVDATTAGLL